MNIRMMICLRKDFSLKEDLANLISQGDKKASTNEKAFFDIFVKILNHKDLTLFRGVVMKLDRYLNWAVNIKPFNCYSQLIPKCYH